MVDINDSVNPIIIQDFESIKSIKLPRLRSKVKVMRSSCSGISRPYKSTCLGVSDNIDLQLLESVLRRVDSRYLEADGLMNSHNDSLVHRLEQ